MVALVPAGPWISTSSGWKSSSGQSSPLKFLCQVMQAMPRRASRLNRSGLQPARSNTRVSAGAPASGWVRSGAASGTTPSCSRCGTTSCSSALTSFGSSALCRHSRGVRARGPRRRAPRGPWARACRGRRGWRGRWPPPTRRAAWQRRGANCQNRRRVTGEFSPGVVGRFPASHAESWPSERPFAPAGGLGGSFGSLRSLR